MHKQKTELLLECGRGADEGWKLCVRETDKGRDRQRDRQRQTDKTETA